MVLVGDIIAVVTVFIRKITLFPFLGDNVLFGHCTKGAFLSLSGPPSSALLSMVRYF